MWQAMVAVYRGRVRAGFVTADEPEGTAMTADILEIGPAHLNDSCPPRHAAAANSALALAADPSVIEQTADPGEFIIQACDRARTWLHEVLDHGDIDQIAECKSQAEAVRVYTMSKQLGKDAQLSATEIVRRAERGIAVAIRRGQQSRMIAKRGDRGSRGAAGVHGGNPGDTRGDHLGSPSSFFRHGKERADSYAMTDGVSQEDFEEAVAEAKAEGNLSRANLVRKIREQHGHSQGMDGPGTPVPEPEDSSPDAAQARRDLITRLAAERLTSRQIAARLRISYQQVREIAREHGIAITADAVAGRTRRIDSTRIVRETAHALEGLVMGIELADLAELDPADADEWAASIARSARALTRFARQIKEVTR
jgi:hypothetical protein